MKKIEPKIELTFYQTRRLFKVLERLDTTYSMHIEGDASKEELKFAEEVEKVRTLILNKFDKKIKQIKKQLKNTPTND
jgi:hypothetical protein